VTKLRPVKRLTPAELAAYQRQARLQIWKRLGWRLFLMMGLGGAVLQFVDILRDYVRHPDQYGGA